MRIAGENFAASAASYTPQLIGGCSSTAIDNLLAQLACRPWGVSAPETIVSGEDASVCHAIGTVADRLGNTVAGRGGRTEQEIEPTDTFRAHARFASAQTGLGPLPLHVEYSNSRGHAGMWFWGAYRPVGAVRPRDWSIVPTLSSTPTSWRFSIARLCL